MQMEKGKKALVAGCGYLGSRIVQELLNLGHFVFATTRARPDYIKSLGATPIVCDFSQPITAKFPSFHSVVYSAASDSTGTEGFRAVHLDGLISLARALLANGFAGRFVLISSTSVYAQEDGSWVDEKSPTSPQSESGKILLEAEERLREIYPTAMILRFAGIYGPGRLIRAKSILQGEKLVCHPNRWLNLIHVEDGAQATTGCLFSKATEVLYNICDNHPVSREEFYREMARILNAPTPQFVLPPEGSPIAARETNNRRISNTLMKRDLLINLRFPTFRDGLKDGESLLRKEGS